MSGSTTESTSLGRFSSSASADSLQTNELLTYRSKGRELAQKMLSEIEDVLRGFDADLKALHNKPSFANQQSWSDVPLQPSGVDASSSSLESWSLPSRSKLSWGIRDSRIWRLSSSAMQTMSEDGSGEDTSLLTLIRSIYKMVSTEIAPKLYGVTQEVTELRKSNEQLSEKVEQQRLRNDKLLEEFEDLQSELSAKDTQLREQRRASKNLDIYQGENEMLKEELNSLRVRVEKLGGSSTPQPVVREVPEKLEVPCKRTPSSEWLIKENEELQREVTRWRAETSEKDVLIHELKDAIKNLTTAETPRSPVQRKLSAARPDALLGSSMGANRAFSEATQDGGTALTLETPRGRIRSSLMERLSPFVPTRRSPSVTTLAQDLRMLPAAATDISKEQVAAVSDRRRSRRRSGFPSAPPFTSTHAVVESADAAAGLGSLNTAPRREVSHWVEATSEAMERALFEIEDIRASRIKDAKAWECSNAHLKELLMQAEEKLQAATTEVQRLTGECNAAHTEQRETQEKIDDVSKQLEESRCKTAELQAALEKTELAMQAAHKEAAATEHRLTETIAAAEKQIVALEEMIAFRDELIMSVVRNTNNLLAKQHMQASEDVEQSNIQALGTSGADPPLRRPWRGLAAEDKHERVTGGCPLQFCGSKQVTQQPDASRGEKLKVVFRPQDDACCSPWGCLKLWNNGGGDAAQPLYSIQPPNDREGRTWPSRKSQVTLKTAVNTGRFC